MADSPETALEKSSQYFIFVTQVYFCSMYAVVIWDWITSFPREWRFVWKTRWTPVKISYLFCRYWVMAIGAYLLYAFVGQHSLSKCRVMYKIPVTLAMWNQVGSESVLLIRTYAFFNRSIWILVLLIMTLAGVVAYQLYVATSQMLLLPFVPESAISGPCFPMSKPHSAHLLGFFIAPLLFDTFVTMMTVLKALNIRRHNGGPSSRLIQTFLREGIFYYILISIANLVNGIFYLQPRQVMSAINIPLSVMMGPVLACRLILDLRERGSETVTYSEGTGLVFTTKSNSQASPYNGPNGNQIKSGKAPHRTTTTISSNVILSTLGSIPIDMDADKERDAVEMSDIHFGFGLAMASGSTGTVNDGTAEKESSDGDGGAGSPAPAYQSIEMGFARRSSVSVEEERTGVAGIRVDVEKLTVSM